MFKESNLKDLGERCAMTFIQAFLGIVAAGPLVGMDVEPMKAGAAAGVAAVQAPGGGGTRRGTNHGSAGLRRAPRVYDPSSVPMDKSYDELRRRPRSSSSDGCGQSILSHRELAGAGSFKDA